MKKILLILTLILPFTCSARYAWGFSDISILAGQQYRYGQGPFWSVELQYDHVFHSCLVQHRYKGVGLKYSFSGNKSEFGIKGMINPTLFSVNLSRKTRIYPYLFGQANLFRMEIQDPTSNENKLKSGFNFRPGIGLTAFKRNKNLNLRASLQLGYTIAENYSPRVANALSLEFKVGVGFGIFNRKRG